MQRGCSLGGSPTRNIAHSFGTNWEPRPVELLIENPDATFAVRVAGDSMIDAGIFPGDIAIVDRSKTAVDRSIVLAILDGEFTLKRFRKHGHRCWLEAENSHYGPTELTEDSAFEIWGVIKKSIRLL
jgi:DNA polymerase V